MCVSKVQLIRMSRKGSALKKRITVSLLDKCRICRDAQIKTNQTSVWYGMVNQTSVWYNMVNTKAQYGMVWSTTITECELYYNLNLVISILLYY